MPSAEPGGGGQYLNCQNAKSPGQGGLFTGESSEFAGEREKRKNKVGLCLIAVLFFSEV